MMKQIPSEKLSIAWFKLADCVSRGEKERALGVYRLLAHSLNDDALVAQLKGDIFMCFDDKENAIEQYTLAADLYERNGKLFHSVAMYEQLLLLSPKTELFQNTLERLYRELEK